MSFLNCLILISLSWYQPPPSPWPPNPLNKMNRFYGLSAKLNEAFTNDGKDLVLQFSVKNEQKLDCGGAYIKLTGDVDQDSFGGNTPYQVRQDIRSRFLSYLVGERGGYSLGFCSHGSHGPLTARACLC